MRDGPDTNAEAPEKGLEARKAPKAPPETLKEAVPDATSGGRVPKGESHFNGFDPEEDDPQGCAEEAVARQGCNGP